MAVNLSPVGGVAAQFFDNSGNPLTGGKLFTYFAGTTTPATTYTSAAGSIAQPNPIILDAAGRVPGSGEIWLTDGVEYKFVLTTSTDVLIATYDNINGINSNFVNYTNQQELQTATAGQTVFTLNTMQYQPGTNSLSVFVDGVNQYGPGATYAYVETSSTVVTFTSGLHVGAEVKFTTSQLNSAAATNAEQVSYDPPYTGTVATNVEVKLSETISVWDFGAHPSNSRAANDIAFQDAFDWLRDREKGATLVIPAGEYDLSANLTLLANVEMDARSWLIEGNGATLNWANSGLATGAALEIGATGNNFTYREATFINIRNLRIIGPETQNCAALPVPFFPTADTTTIGLKLNSALDVVMDNIVIRRFFTGIYARNCWPITANAVNCIGNYVGIQLGRDCTIGTWTGCSVQASAYCLVMQPDAIDETIACQTFIGMRFENSLRGVTMDQRTSTSGTSANIRQINFVSPAFEAISYDLVRMGQAWEYANISIPNAERNTAYCQAITFTNGFWEPPKVSGYSIRASSNGYVRGCDISIPVGTNSQIFGNLALSKIFYQPYLTGGLSTGQTFFPQGTPQVFGNEIQFNTNDGRVDFQGITSTSTGTSTTRKLGDYDGGTWVPEFVPATGSFGSVTYDAITTGTYTKIGNMVFVRGAIRTDAITVGTASGAVSIGNLPYTAAARNFPAVIGAVSAFGGDFPGWGQVGSGTDELRLFYRTSVNGATIALDVTDLGTGANANDMEFSAVYTVST